MQTFLPLPDFARSAARLDRQRLGKQRVEAMQIMTALVDGRGWVNHPATRMWTSAAGSLWRYQQAICAEWAKRGYKDTCLEKTRAVLERADQQQIGYGDPWWLGRDEFHAAHRSALLRKAPEHYGAFGWAEPDDLEYWWPTEHEEISK